MVPTTRLSKFVNGVRASITHHNCLLLLLRRLAQRRAAPLQLVVTRRVTVSSILARNCPGEEVFEILMEMWQQALFMHISLRQDVAVQSS